MGSRLKIATFNLWHGLAGRGVLRFREFETEARRDDRFRLGLRLLLELDPDIVLFQELNPVSRQGREISRVIGGQFTGRVDQSGLKLLGHGLPLNLATGLGTVIRGSVGPGHERPGDPLVPAFVRLSGSMGFSGESSSFHLDERRYAQMQSVQHAGLGRLLIANMHLHHGFERFAVLMDLLKTAVQEGRVTAEEQDSLYEYLDRAGQRRLNEIDHLLEKIHPLEKDHDGVLLGGDLNSTPDGMAYRALIGDGFTDLALVKSGRVEGPKRGDGPTWDPAENPENHRIQREQGFEFPLPSFGNPKLTDVYQAFDEQPRRIDFLLAKGSLSRPSRVERFGFPQKIESGEQLAPSDHFGLMATFDGGEG